jgi:DNA mismatch endonuclease, patch repair protein
MNTRRKNVVPADVSARMRAVTGKNSVAEQKLQTALLRKGLTFKKHLSLLGCFPDFVFQLSRVVVFVDGDFWHGRLLLEQGEKALQESFRRHVRSFWVSKISRNAARDRRQNCRLRRHGWCVLRFWEREILRDADAAAATIAKRVLQRKNILHSLGDS